MIMRRVQLFRLATAGLTAMVTGTGVLADTSDSVDSRFIERPGIMELSGRMIARPYQARDLQAKGYTAKEALVILDRAERRIENLAVYVIEYRDVTGEYIFALKPDQTESEVADQLMATGDYQYVDPDWIVYPLETCPDDDKFDLQWHHVNMASCLGWDIHTGNPTTSVGICDTGVRPTHEDLKNYRLEGYNAVRRKWESEGGDITDINGHGTATTGCATAEGNNGVGVSGIGWTLSHRMLRVSEDAGGGAFLSDLTHAALTAVQYGSKVASVSYSGVQENSVETTGQAIMDTYGGLLCWAAGNESTRWDSSDWEHVIIVGATDSNDGRAVFSNYGLFIDVMAPGVDIATTHLTGDSDYAYWSGTSFSCPITAGLCALLFSAAPDLGPYDIMNALYEGCNDMGDQDRYGWGRVNVFASLLLVSGVTPDAITTRISQLPNGTGGNGDSINPSVSDDGSTIVFGSVADNLVPNDTNGYSDIFVTQRGSGILELVSLSTEGGQANGDSTLARTSADGSLITFVSTASNLVPNDTNGLSDIFVYNRATGQMKRVSVSSTGQQANGTSSKPSLSGDGRFVAFHSAATNLVTGDTNGMFDVFVHDLQTGQTTRVSVDRFGKQGNGHSYHARLSDDGRYVAFESEAENLIPNDSSGAADIFVHDRQTQLIERVSIDSQGRQSNGANRNPDMSGDGNLIVWASDASNLVVGDTNNVRDIFLHDRTTHKTTRISVAEGNVQANDESDKPAISATGRHVVFESRARNLVLNDSNGRRDIFMADRLYGTVVRSSTSTTQQQGNGASYVPDVSSTGRYTVFTSFATNLIDSDLNGVGDVFMNDRNMAFRLLPATLVAGQEATIEARFASPNKGEYLVYSKKGLGEKYVEQLNVTLDLLEPHLGAEAMSDEHGNVEWVIKVRSGAAGRTVWLQAAEYGNKTGVLEVVIE